MCVTTTSAWPWIAHLVSGLRPTTQSPCSDSLSLRLPYSVKLAIERKSLTHYAKGTQSPLRAPTVCMYAVSGSISLPSRGSFRLSFTVLVHYRTPLPGFFSPFLHSTGSLSVDHEYLALEDGPPIFEQDFTCPALLVAVSVPSAQLRIRGCHPLWPDFPDRSAAALNIN